MVNRLQKFNRKMLSVFHVLILAPAYMLDYLFDTGGGNAVETILTEHIVFSLFFTLILWLTVPLVLPLALFKWITRDATDFSGYNSTILKFIFGEDE